MKDYNRYEDEHRYDRKKGNPNRFENENDAYNSNAFNDEKYRQNINRQSNRNYDYDSDYENQNRRGNFNRYNRDYDQQGNRNYGGFAASDSGHNYGNRGNYNEEQERETHNYGSNYGSAYGAVGYFNDRSRDDDDRTENRNYSSGYNNAYGNNYERERRARWENDRRDWWDRAADEVASWFGDDDAERRRRRDKAVGPHKGKGPRNYKRSDNRIKDDINDKLSDDTYVDASDIEVTVTEGVVVLSGTVDSKHVKRRAEDIADAISGVSNVENHLHVAKNTTHVGSSAVYSGNSNNKNKQDFDTDKTV